MDGWKKVWEGREGLTKEFLEENKDSEIITYAKLKKLDGFDVSVDNENAYNSFLDEFEAMFDMLKKLTVDKGEIRSVYEVGCGSGANLYLFRNRIKEFSGGGSDFSEKQIETAKTVFPEMEDLKNLEAVNIPIEPRYDVVMSESVFQYFPSDEYAGEVVDKMIAKAKKIVYIGEICDAVYEEEQMAARRAKIENYDEVYKGLGRKFYSREFFEALAAKHNKSIKFTACENEEYVNGKYMFNCYIY